VIVRAAVFLIQAAAGAIAWVISPDPGKWIAAVAFGFICGEAMRRAVSGSP